MDQRDRASSVQPGLGPPSQPQKQGDGQTRHAGRYWSCLGQGRRGTKASLGVYSQGLSFPLNLHLETEGSPEIFRGTGRHG